METELKTARELFQTYKKHYQNLVNIYCQVKRKRPFEEFPDLAAAIWRVGMNLEIWHILALKEAKNKFFQGG